MNVESRRMDISDLLGRKIKKNPLVMAAEKKLIETMANDTYRLTVLTSDERAALEANMKKRCVGQSCHKELLHTLADYLMHGNYCLACRAKTSHKASPWSQYPKR